jgi:hypothetical protein
MIVKLQCKPKKSTEAPFVVDVPDVFTQAFVIEKESKRFPKSGGWDTRCSTTKPYRTSTRPIPALRLRTLVPYGREGEGLHLPPVPEALNCAYPALSAPAPCLPQSVHADSELGSNRT